MSEPVEVVCEHCAHAWTWPHEDDLPDRCESCDWLYLRVFPLRIVGNADAAEEYSASVLDSLKLGALPDRETFVVKRWRAQVEANRRLAEIFPGR